MMDTYPTSPFPILEPENPWIDEFYVVQEERRATDFKASKIVKKSSSAIYLCVHTRDSCTIVETQKRLGSSFVLNLD